MTLNPFAPAFLPHYQSPSDPLYSLCNSTAMSFTLAHSFCGILPPIIPSQDPPFNQPINYGTSILPLVQPISQFNQDGAAHPPPPGSSSFLSSPLQHRANCLQDVHKTIQQFNQHLKGEHLDRQTLQLTFLQLQNDFALLRYLLFSSVGTISNKDTAVKNSFTSPLCNHSPIPTSTALQLPFADAPKLPRSTPVGAVGPPRSKMNNSANAEFQPNPNTQEALPTTMQNLTSRIYRREKFFGDEIATYTSITAGIHSQHFFFKDKIRQIEPVKSDSTHWKIPSVKFVFDSAKLARPPSDPLIESATSFSSPIFRTHPHGYNFFIKFNPYGIRPATGKCASISSKLFPGDYDSLLQWPFSMIIYIGIRDKLDPLNTWTKTIQPDQDPAYKTPSISTKTGDAAIIINNFIPHSTLFNKTEGFLIDGASFIEIKFSDLPVLKSHTQTSLLLPFP